MLSAGSLTDHLRRLAPEAMAFGVIGAGNTLLYLAITWAALPIGAVKASILATVVTTTLAYFANRYWTYRHHTRTALRREYTLFFGFNLVGMVIQSGAIAIGKYGFGLTEEHDELAFLCVTALGVVIGTVFRFWAYRTFVFLKPPVDGHEAELAELDPVAGLAELSAEEELAELSADEELAELSAEEELAELSADEELAELSAEEELAELSADEELAELSAEEELAELELSSEELDATR